MTYPIQVTKDNYHKAVLKILSALTNLTDYEINIVATMAKNNIYTLEPDTRKKIRDLLATDQFTFNNYIKRLKTNKTLIKTQHGLELNSNLKLILAGRELTIKVTMI